MSTETKTIVELSLDQLVLGDNIRFGLKPYTVEHLAKQILSMGGIHTALKVEPHSDGTYMVREGFRRYAAALWLKQQHGTEITLPCIIEPVTADPAERIYKQLSENRDRDNLSPMDTSNAILRLIELGEPKTKIMEKFARPGGRGKTPGKMEPLSQTAYRYYTRYQELPAEAKQMLHDGTLAVNAANRFLDEPDADKRARLLIHAEQKRQERLSEQESQERRLERLEAAAAKDRETVEVTGKEIGELEKELVEKKTVSDAAFKDIGNLKGPKREEARKLYRTAAKATSEIEQKLKTAQSAKKKAQLRLRQETFQARHAAEEGRQTHRKRSPITKKDVDAAMADAGRARLGAIDMRAAVKYWTEAPFPKVKLMALIIQRTFDSILTPVQARQELAKITGEEKRLKKKTGKR